MSFINWAVQPETVFVSSVVIPVLVISELDHAIPLAKALFAGGINVLEVTLRTPVALDAVHLLTKNFPDVLIGVGTVTTPDQLHQAIEVGAKFAISPGQTQDLLLAGREANIPFIPGIASVSDLMEGLGLGYTHFKFFPAAVAGGIPMLRALYGPFPQAQFCPTGGIHVGNFRDYLNLPNVACVGGSWIAPDEAIKREDWSLITDLCLSIKE
jgi:2-dehydro-3-deoxyphosphogluconate aldolase/(4S)-4-hydroxy-2-oxoglutarate aldolase